MNSESNRFVSCLKWLYSTVKTDQPKGISVPLPDRWESFALIRKSWAPVPKSIHGYISMGQVAGALLLNFGKQNSYALLGAGSPDPLSLSLGRLLSFRNFLEPPARIISIFVMRASLSALEELLGQIWSWSSGRRSQEEALLLWRGYDKHRCSTRFKCFRRTSLFMDCSGNAFLNTKGDYQITN